MALASRGLSLPVPWIPPEASGITSQNIIRRQLEDLKYTHDMSVCHTLVRPLVPVESDSDGCSAALPPMPPTFADYSDCIVIPLTNQQKTVSHLAVDLAFHYPNAADPGVLVAALSEELVSFPTLCSRLVRRRRKYGVSEADDDDDELMLCVPKLQYPVSGWAHVPFSHQQSQIQPPKQDGIAPDLIFDIATDCIPSVIISLDSSSYGTCINESVLGAPLTRIKVITNSSESQTIALSINHALVDAKSISLLMSAWSKQYQHCRNGYVGAGARASFDHPIFQQRKTQNGVKSNSTSSIPEDWKKLLPKEEDGTNPFVGNATSTTNNSTCTVYYRSPEQISQLKQQFREFQIDELQLGTPHPPYLSSNDALCGEVCTQIDATSLLLCMDWRPVLQRKDFFGYGVLFLYLSYPTAMHAPTACRTILGWKDAHGNVCNGIARDPNFVIWKMENEWRQGKTHLIWNSWVDFFVIRDKGYDGNDSKVSAKMESHPDDIMMSQQMCQMRIDVAAKAGLCYCIVFPQPKGVRVYFFGPHKRGHDLSSSNLKV